MIYTFLKTIIKSDAYAMKQQFYIAKQIFPFEVIERQITTAMTTDTILYNCHSKERILR